MEAELIGISGIGGAGLVWATVQTLRNMVGVNIIKDQFTTPLAIAVGIGLNCLLKLDNWVDLTEASWTATALLGVVTGLSASGISGVHSVAKKVINGG